MARYKAAVKQINEKKNERKGLQNEKKSTSVFNIAHSEIDGKLNDEINVQAAREYARRRCNQTQTRNTMRHEHKRKNNSLPLKGNLNIFSSLNKKRITTPCCIAVLR